MFVFQCFVLAVKFWVAVVGIVKLGLEKGDKILCCPAGCGWLFC